MAKRRRRRRKPGPKGTHLIGESPQVVDSSEPVNQVGNRLSYERRLAHTGIPPIQSGNPSLAPKLSSDEQPPIEFDDEPEPKLWEIIYCIFLLVLLIGFFYFLMHN